MDYKQAAEKVLDDYADLRKVFPNRRDFFHISGKFYFPCQARSGKWELGEETRKKLADSGFKWEIRNPNLIVYDR